MLIPQESCHYTVPDWWTQDLDHLIRNLPQEALKPRQRRPKTVKYLSYIDSLWARREELFPELIVCSIGSVQLTTNKIRLNCRIVKKCITSFNQGVLLAARHSFKRSEERKLETITPPSRAMISLIFSIGSEASIVTTPRGVDILTISTGEK